MTQIKILSKHVTGSPTQKVNIMDSIDQGYIHEKTLQYY